MAPDVATRISAAHCTRCVVLALAASGCLSQHYTVDRRELARLAQSNEHAGGEVRVRQRLVSSVPPEDAEPATMLHEAVETATTAVDAVRTTHAVVAVVNETIGTDAKPEPANADNSTQKQEQAKKEKKSDASTALIVGVVVVAGVFVGIALAGSEGARFDGKVALPASQPVHLMKDGVEIGWVPAHALRPVMLREVDEAIVSDDDGRLPRLARSPLERRGLAYQVEVGAGGMNTLSRDPSLGFAGRMALGFFPAQALGLFAGAALQTGAKGFQETATEVRPLIEAQLLPVRVGSIHAGVYAEGGYVFGSERVEVGVTRPTRSWAAGGGLIGQVDLSTFLALFIRVGALALPDPRPTAVAPQASLGIAIY